MSIEETQNNKFYEQARQDWFNRKNNSDHYTGKEMDKWIRKRIRILEKEKH
jgi:hypothetical protein